MQKGRGTVTAVGTGDGTDRLPYGFGIGIRNTAAHGHCGGNRPWHGRSAGLSAARRRSAAGNGGAVRGVFRAFGRAVSAAGVPSDGGRQTTVYDDARGTEAVGFGRLLGCEKSRRGGHGRCCVPVCQPIGLLLRTCVRRYGQRTGGVGHGADFRALFGEVIVRIDGKGRGAEPAQRFSAGAQRRMLGDGRSVRN